MTAKEIQKPWRIADGGWVCLGRRRRERASNPPVMPPINADGSPPYKPAINSMNRIPTGSTDGGQVLSQRTAKTIMHPPYATASSSPNTAPARQPSKASFWRGTSGSAWSIRSVISRIVSAVISLHPPHPLESAKSASSAFHPPTPPATPGPANGGRCATAPARPRPRPRAARPAHPAAESPGRSTRLRRRPAPN